MKIQNTRKIVVGIGGVLVLAVLAFAGVVWQTFAQTDEKSKSARF